ncbi:diacylglycerol kinase family protein [Jeotgalibaca porci]|uniref:diacylglycerol/lipid kinase family protein n=1 Tax=Jeotgalibaca porci TaxID=1868793 RepID=UPI0035A063A2
MGKVLLVVNPSSGQEAGKRYADSVAEALEKKYSEVVVKYTEKAGDATAFAKEAAQERYEAVFVMGGDGTVNEGVSGLAEEAYRPKFSFIPLGTVNDLGRSLGISMDPEEAISQLDRLVEKKLDVGKINNHYFIDVVAIGTIPEAVQAVEPEQKTKLGSFAYVLEGLKAVRDNKSYLFDMTIDGEKIQEESMAVLIALTNSVGGMETLLPNASYDDGKLHLIVLKGDHLVDKLGLLPKIFSGKAMDDRNVLYRAFEKGHFSVEDGDDLVTNVDGDPGDKLPLDITVLPQHLTVLVPE